MTSEVVQLTQELIRCQTVNPPGNEGVAINLCAARLGDHGFEVEKIVASEGRASLVSRLPGGSGMPICFSGHVDTVPLGVVPWTVPAFDGVLAAGRIYGRGASDMKSGVAAMIIALERLATIPKRLADVYLVLSWGEETGCEGARSLVRRPTGLPEFGAIVVGEPTDNQVLIGHKGALWAKLETQGVAAHGSTPELGRNAVLKLAANCLRLQNVEDTSSHPAMGSHTINVGTFHGGSNINSVPDWATAEVDIRTTPAMDGNAILSWLIRTVDPDVGITAVLDLPPVLSDPEGSWVRRVENLRCRLSPHSRNSAGPEASIATYFTDASVLVSACGNPATVICGPGSSTQAHQRDEYCLVEQLERSVDIYHEIAREWVAGEVGSSA